MRSKLVLLALLMAACMFIVPLAHGQTDVTIQQLQQVPLDSLLLMDTQQSAARTSLDETQYVKTNDTVRVTGVVIVKPRILTYTLARYNIFIQDTLGQVWAGLNILTNDTSAGAQSTGITAVDTGDVITITGRALEFGSQPNSLTELYHYSATNPAYTTPEPISLVRHGSRPAPIEVAVDSFAVGTTPMPSRGEKYEGMYVVIRNVTVVSVDPSSGRFSFQDASGNQMTMYDGSGYYTLRGHKYSNSKYTPPPVGTKLSYIRGVILTQSLSGTAGDYEIMPMYPGPSQLTGTAYPGDFVVGQYAPSITSVLRTPQAPHSTDTVVVTYKAKDLNASGGIDSTALYYKVGSASWVRVKGTPTSGDSLYTVTVPAAANDSLVSYYVTAYAKGSITGSYPNPSVPLFYRVRDNGLTVYDLQYTPYSNGTSGFKDDTVTVAGVVVSDTTVLKENNTRPRLYIAGAAGAWNGIAIYGNNAGVGVDTLSMGDSVTVSGICRESFSKTEIQVLSVTVNATGRPLPTPATMSISGAGSVSYQLTNPPVDGNATFEKWEGVVVSISPAPYVVYSNADNLNGNVGSNFGEFFISSSSSTTSASGFFGLRVDDNGVNAFFVDSSSGYLGAGGRYFIDHPNTPTIKKKRILPVSQLSSLVGVLDYSFSFYKLEPRGDADFGTAVFTGVHQEPNVVPEVYSLDQNYPNPFNPSTTIRYSIPHAAYVTMRIYNLLGQVVETLVSAKQEAGAYVVQFDASRLATGLYFYRLDAGDFSMSKKMLLLK